MINRTLKPRGDLLDNNIKVVNRLFIYLFSFVYLTILLSLPNFIFKDRVTYIAYIEQYDFFSTKTDGLLEYLVNEPVFLFFNYLLKDIVASDIVPKIYVFFILFSIIICLKKYSSNFVMFFLGLVSLIIIPYTFHLQLVILRQGIATAILLLALCFFKDNRKHLVVCLFVSLIHSSFFLIFLYLLINNFLKKYNRGKRYFVLFLFNIFMGFFVLVLANMLGFRQSEDLLLADSGGSGGAWLLWLIVYVYMIFYGKKDNSYLYDYAMIGLISFLSLYFLNPISGRLVCSFIPAVIVILVSDFKYQSILIVSFIILLYGYIVYNGALVGLSLAQSNSALIDALYGALTWFL
ncbi:EpsG family protein [Acinetobacter ursingii]|uniref:EpsG family protein n=1 Tax=Acinetobacter ursingii TaxID=108980 RepID=UPI003AF97333